MLGTGCGGPAVWYAPPVQRQASVPPASLGFSHFVTMSDLQADAYIVQGFRAKSEGSWRWAHDHPVLRFWLPPAARVKFCMDFAFPEQTFRKTGPVTLNFTINGKPFDRVLYSQPGSQRYSRPVAPVLLHLGGVNTVAIDADKWALQEGGEHLAFVLTSAGFVE